MVYIPPSRASFAAELGSIAGIDNIEPVFKNAKPSNIPGVEIPRAGRGLNYLPQHLALSRLSGHSSPLRA